MKCCCIIVRNNYPLLNLVHTNGVLLATDVIQQHLGEVTPITETFGVIHNKMVWDNSGTYLGLISGFEFFSKITYDFEDSGIVLEVKEQGTED